MNSYRHLQVQPPLVLGFSNYEFSYSPLSLRYVPSVIVETGTSKPVTSSNLRLVVENPTSILPGYIQALPKKVSISVPVDGKVDLKLIPSDLYKPKGYYHVKLYEGNNKIPLDESWWVVPHCPVKRSVNIKRGDTDRDFVSSNPIFSITKVDHADSFTLEDGHIVWADGGGPGVGEVYSVTYQPSLRLSDVVVQKPN